METLTPKLISVWIYKLGITTSGWTRERNKLLLPEMKSTWPVCWWQHQNQLQVTACGCRAVSHSCLPSPEPQPVPAHSLQAGISQGSYTTSACGQRTLSSTAASPAGFLSAPALGHSFTLPSVSAPPGEMEFCALRFL